MSDINKMAKTFNQVKRKSINDMEVASMQNTMQNPLVSQRSPSPIIEEESYVVVEQDQDVVPAPQTPSIEVQQKQTVASSR